MTKIAIVQLNPTPGDFDKSGAKILDAFNKIPEPGDAFGVNFQRMGQTCGRHSAWAKNGGAFDTSRWVFGTLIIGKADDYLRRRFSGYAGRCRDVAAASPSAVTQMALTPAVSKRYS